MQEEQVLIVERFLFTNNYLQLQDRPRDISLNWDQMNNSWTLERFIEYLKGKCPENCDGRCIYDKYFFLDCLIVSNCVCSDLRISQLGDYIEISPETDKEINNNKSFITDYENSISKVHLKKYRCDQCQSQYVLQNYKEPCLLIVVKCNYDHCNLLESLKMFRAIFCVFDGSHIAEGLRSNYIISSCIFKKNDRTLALTLQNDSTVWIDNQRLIVDKKNALLCLACYHWKLEYSLYQKIDLNQSMVEIKKNNFNSIWRNLSYEIMVVYKKKNLSILKSPALADIKQMLREVD